MHSSGSKNDYREFLVKELSHRCSVNPNYSLRSFAKDLDISPSHLSHVLSGKYGVSKVTAEKISKKLGLTAREKDLFCASIALHHSRSILERNLAKATLKNTLAPWQVIKGDSFEFMSKWYVLPLIQLTRTSNFKNDPKWMARTLDIPEIEIKRVIAYLKKTKILIETADGKLKAQNRIFLHPGDVPSQAVREAHDQLISRARLALHSQSVQERDFTHLTVSMNPEDMPMVKQMIEKFQLELEQALASAEPKKLVYGLNVHFFSLTKNITPNNQLPTLEGQRNENLNVNRSTCF